MGARVRRRSRRSILLAILLVGVVLLGFAVNLLAEALTSDPLVTPASSAGSLVEESIRNAVGHAGLPGDQRTELVDCSMSGTGRPGTRWEIEQRAQLPSGGGSATKRVEAGWREDAAGRWPEVVEIERDATDQASLTVNRGALMIFVLGSRTGDMTDATLGMTVYDSAGNIVLSIDSKANRAASTRTLYLAAGKYTVKYNSSGAVLTKGLTYNLQAMQLTDNIGPYSTTTTGTYNDSGYTYAGASSTSTVTDQYWF